MTDVLSALRTLERKATRGQWHPESPHDSGRSVCHGHEIWTDGMWIGQMVGMANLDFANAHLICALRNYAIVLIEVAEAAIKMRKDVARLASYRHENTVIGGALKESTKALDAALVKLEGQK